MDDIFKAAIKNADDLGSIVTVPRGKRTDDDDQKKTIQSCIDELPDCRVDLGNGRMSRTHTYHSAMTHEHVGLLKMDTRCAINAVLIHVHLKYPKVDIRQLSAKLTDVS